MLQMSPHMLRDQVSKAECKGGSEGRRGVGVKMDVRVRMLEAKRTIETGSMFSYYDDTS